MPKYDLRSFTWLGYRVRNNEYVKQEYVDDFNSNPKVRNNYRLLISDGTMSYNAIKRYTDILKTTNMSITRDESTVFGDDVMEYTSAFEGLNVKIPDDASCGNYEIELIATDVQGNTAEIRLTLVLQEPEDDNEEESDTSNTENDKEETVVESFLGRFFYRDGKGYLEELKKVDNSDICGFICAGETLGFTLVTENIDYIEIDFKGNESIKTLDSLTKRFLIDVPAQNGKDTSDIEYQYMSFPKKIYPQYVDNSGMQVFKWFYVIPYRTSQSLESWSSLKDDTLENIDTTKLFERIIEPYALEVYPNGEPEKAIHLHFDVFERWDTVLNRDITQYVVNSDSRWEMRIDK
ncbi:MAG: hypothetical protein IJ272_02755 [Clostridia bacterium]|nr:hypothetical protein [Clostridia bacterium]